MRYPRIAEKVWSTCDSVDEAIAEAEHTIDSEQPKDETQADNQPSLPCEEEGKGTEPNVQTHTAEDTRENSEINWAIEHDESPNTTQIKNVANPTTHKNTATRASTMERERKKRVITE